jgi:gibberellin 2-oxidase
LQANEKQIKGTEVKDNVESFNFAKFTQAYADQPFHPFFEPFRAEMADFSRVRETVYNCSFNQIN